MPSLKGKVIVLTGASAGIGRATALALARDGAKIHLVARRQQRLAQLSDEVKTLGGDASVHVQDVREPGVFEEIRDKVVAADGKVDVVINNAGVGVTKKFLETSQDDWDWTFDTNFAAVVASARAFLR